MTSIDQTAFARLEKEGRLLNPVNKGPTEKPGRFGFRGEIALKFAAQLADEKRPPELSAEQVLATADGAAPTIPFLAVYLLSFESLKPLAEVMNGTLAPDGKYFVFCNNIDLLSKYRVPMGDITFYVLPIDEATVYNEVLELLYLEKNDLKKKTSGGKLDAIADTAAKFSADYEIMSYEEGLKRMGPVRNPNENRPV